mmetsp:Transcript_79677/g.172205  ORF Transcript_79677/g.172205 Transcript_79677/m.172205 type:complete len:274 (-) Transcript_79677:469-1290(-)
MVYGTTAISHALGRLTGGPVRLPEGEELLPQEGLLLGADQQALLVGRVVERGGVAHGRAGEHHLREVLAVHAQAADVHVHVRAVAVHGPDLHVAAKVLRVEAAQREAHAVPGEDARGAAALPRPRAGALAVAGGPRLGLVAQGRPGRRAVRAVHELPHVLHPPPGDAATLVRHLDADVLLAVHDPAPHHRQGVVEAVGVRLDRRPAGVLEDLVEHVVQVHRQVGQRRRLVRAELHLLHDDLRGLAEVRPAERRAVLRGLPGEGRHVAAEHEDA